MDIEDLRNDLMNLCEKHELIMGDLKWEMPRLQNREFHASTVVSPDPSNIHHRSIIRSECQETICISVEFESKVITYSDGSSWEKQ